MPPSLLFMRNRNGTNQAVFRYEGATTTQLGNDLPSAVEASGAFSVNLPAPRNRVIQFRGDLYAFGSDGIYRKDDPTVTTGNWTQVHAFANPELSDQQRLGGIFLVYVADAPILCAVLGTDTANDRWIGVTSSDGTTWTEQTEADTGLSRQAIINMIVYRNQVHIAAATTSSVDALLYNPATGGFSVPANTWLGSATAGPAFCVFNDRLFAWCSATTSSARLYEFTGGAWVEIAGTGVSFPVNQYDQCKWGLFTDGTNLYAIGPALLGDGWRIYQWSGPNPTGVPTDISATVLPAALRSPNDGGSFLGDIELARVFVVVDQDTTPTTADIWLYFTADSTQGTTFSLYQWNGTGAVIGNAGSPDDVGGDVFHAVPDGLIQAGERIFTPGELDILITGKDAVVGGERVRFRAYGAAGAADKTVRLYFNTEGEPALTQCTLTGVSVISGSPAGAPSLGVNAALNIDADPSVEYGVIWDIGTDGVSAGDRVQVKAQLSV